DERARRTDVDRVHRGHRVVPVRGDAVARERVPDAAAPDPGEMDVVVRLHHVAENRPAGHDLLAVAHGRDDVEVLEDTASGRPEARKSTRRNSSHVAISYA